MRQELSKSMAGVALILLFIFTTGCASSLYGWQVRTSSTPMPPSFQPAVLEHHTVALFGAITPPALHGNEVALSYELDMILHKVSPNWKVMSPQELAKRINRQGLAGEYTKMRADFEISHILDGGTLRKIASALGVRYVFQPYLAAFTQTMTDRWSFPPIDLRMSQTRSSVMRISLQLWDAETGEIVWGSLAETTMQNEGLSQDPVYLSDVTRATFGSMVTDFKYRKTASTYTPVNKILNDLIEEAVPREKTEDQEITQPSKK
ncbi:MAG: hypothetical protein ACREIG_05555 [Nitrospiraceae bacterium]